MIIIMFYERGEFRVYVCYDYKNIVVFYISFVYAYVSFRLYYD